MSNIYYLTLRVLKIILLWLLFRIEEYFTTMWRQVAKYTINNKQRNKGTHMLMHKYKGLQFCTHVHMRKTTTSWPFLLTFTVCCKPSSCFPRPLVCHYKFAFCQFFFLIAFLPKRDFDFDVFFCLFVFGFFFYSLSVLSAHVNIIRGKVICLTACFFNVVKS